MKHTTVFLVILLTLIMSACTSGVANAPQDDISALAEDALALTTEDFLSTEYENAASLRNQLALGIMALEGTAQAVLAEQAVDLLPLWQAMAVLEQSQNSAQVEVEALQTQLVESLSTEQLQAIADMRLTNDDLAAFYSEQGIEMGSTSGESQGMQGANKDMNEEERAAFRAARQASEAGDSSGSSGSGQERKNILTEEVIAFITELSN